MGDCPDRRTVTCRAVGSAATSDPAQAPPRQALLRRTSGRITATQAIAQPIPDSFESLLEERQNLVAGRDRRLAGLVDQVRGYNAVRGRDVALEERRKIGIRRAVPKHPPDEAITERFRIGRETLPHAELVP